MFSHARQKQRFVTLHRYLGLTAALFLIITGITGALLAYYHELDEWLNPTLFFTPQTASQQGDDYLPASQLYHAAQQYSARYGGRISTVALDFSPGKSLRYYVNGSEQFNRVFINPYTAEVMGSRTWGDLSQGIGNLPGFIYKLHYTLWLPDRWGVLLLGIIALLWTLDCFIAIATTLPVSKQPSLRQFFSRWQQSFKMRWHSRGFSFHFLLHRAAGLWLWALLFIFAWSSVAFNLRDVYKPVTNTLFSAAPAAPVTGHQLPPMNIDQALNAARLARDAAIQQQAQQQPRQQPEQPIHSGRERSLRYITSANTFQYRFHSSRDVDDDIARSVIYIDAHNGELLASYWPSGQYSATTVTQWLYALHMAEVFGWPYQLLVCLLGLMVAYFSYSGVLIWWHKRNTSRNTSRNNSHPKKHPNQYHNKHKEEVD